MQVGSPRGVDVGLDGVGDAHVGLQLAHQPVVLQKEAEVVQRIGAARLHAYGVDLAS